MDSTFKQLEEWRSERMKNRVSIQCHKPNQVYKWRPPQNGILRINVDASFVKNSPACTVGMVLRDHTGAFLAGKNVSFTTPDIVFEAEALGVREALSWIKERRLQSHRIELEIDSLLVVHSLSKRIDNLLEVGEMLEQ